MARYAQWLHADDYLLIHLAVRNTGLFVVAGNPKNIHGIADLARGDALREPPDRFQHSPSDQSDVAARQCSIGDAGLRKQ